MWKEHNIICEPMRKEKKNYKENEEDLRRKQKHLGYWKEQNNKKRAEGRN